MSFTNEEIAESSCVSYEIDNTKIKDARSNDNLLNLNCFTDYTLQYDDQKDYLGFKFTTSQGYETPYVINS